MCILSEINKIFLLNIFFDYQIDVFDFFNIRKK